MAKVDQKTLLAQAVKSIQKGKGLKQWRKWVYEQNYDFSFDPKQWEADNVNRATTIALGAKVNVALGLGFNGLATWQNEEDPIYADENSRIVAEKLGQAGRDKDYYDKLNRREARKAKNKSKRVRHIILRAATDAVIAEVKERRA